MESAVKSDTKEPKQIRQRHHLLDSIRGFLLILMILYHTMFDVTMLGEGNFTVLNTGGYIFQQFIGWGFIFLSGICRTLGKRHMRRGITILGGAMLVSLVSYIFMPQMPINFGILAFMGSATLIMIPLEKLLKDVHAPSAMVISLLLFLLFKNVSQGNLGFEGLELLELPDFLYRNAATAYLGFPPGGFVSGDYYPLIPWLFLYLSGYFFWRCFGGKSQVQKVLSFKVPVLAFLGRRSLLVYLIHQPVCFGVVYLICVIL